MGPDDIWNAEMVHKGTRYEAAGGSGVEKGRYMACFGPVSDLDSYGEYPRYGKRRLVYLVIIWYYP